jgi:hypothetical protein
MTTTDTSKPKGQNKNGKSRDTCNHGDKTQNADEQNKNHTTENLKDELHRPHWKTGS